MNPLILVPFLLLTPLIGRENPFFPASDAQTVTSNISDTAKPLDSLDYRFPDHARVLKEVTLTYQNLDGSFETHKIDVDRAIDWHRSLVISQGKKGDAPVVEKTKSASSADFGFIRFDTKGKWMKIKTSVPMLRHFVLSEPNRIVIDFKKNKIFQKKEFHLNAPPFRTVAVANHRKFARATITLDGRYRHTLTQAGDEIIITCR